MKLVYVFDTHTSGTQTLFRRRVPTLFARLYCRWFNRCADYWNTPEGHTGTLS